MRAKQLLVFSVLAFGIHGVAQATYPADAEWSQYDFQREAGAATWGVGKRVVEPHDPFPFGENYIDD